MFSLPLYSLKVMWFNKIWYTEEFFKVFFFFPVQYEDCFSLSVFNILLVALKG